MPQQPTTIEPVSKNIDTVVTTVSKVKATDIDGLTPEEIFYNPVSEKYMRRTHKSFSDLQYELIIDKEGNLISHDRLVEYRKKMLLIKTMYKGSQKEKLKAIIENSDIHELVYAQRIIREQLILRESEIRETAGLFQTLADEVAQMRLNIRKQ